ncbi:MAG: DUF3791 domain-containing protein [Bacteroidales bacterium]|nr:DUF3791 domain-containing protein [Bacteroidales bacterium]
MNNNNDDKVFFRASKSANIISSISEQAGISLQEATDMFYKSETATMIEEGIADLHCRSEKYLATLVLDEHGKPQVR